MIDRKEAIPFRALRIFVFLSECPSAGFDEQVWDGQQSEPELSR